MRQLLLYILLGFILTPVYAQIVHTKGSPVGFRGEESAIEWYDLNILDQEITRIKELSAKRNDILEFAIARDVSIDRYNSGYVDKINATENVWYLFIRSGGAQSLNIIFEKFKLCGSDYLFIYDPGMMMKLGPFTSDNNKEFGSLPISPLKGSEMIVEFHFDPEGESELKIGRISHDVLGVLNNNIGSSGSKDESGACNIDVNCELASDWQIEKRSVLRVISGGIFLGSAVMLNNTNQENIAYTLTAKHVVRDSSYANNLIAFFNYESPWCEGPDGTEVYSIAGAELIAQNSDIDMALIKLSEFPPLLYKPYLAGWNVSSTIPLRGTAIHHPSYDVKKISFDNDPPIISTFKEFTENGFWKILQWDGGTTEGGSSGSPLFNQDHQVVGYLSGGEAVCGRSVNDYFARLDVAYDLSSNMQNNLVAWLDPAKSGLSYLAGRDPYRENFVNSDTLFNGDESVIELNYYSPQSNGITTGINIDSINAYAEKFEIIGRKYITDIFLFVGSSSFVDQSDSVSISILNDNFGPDQVLARSTVNIHSTKDTFLLRVDFSEAIEVEGTFYISYQNHYKTDAASEPRQFALFYETGQPTSSDFAWFKESNTWYPFSDHPYDPGETSLHIKVITVGNSLVNSIQQENGINEGLEVFPSPFSNKLHINSSTNEALKSIKIFDLTGRMVKSYSGLRSSNIVLQDLGDLKKGFYILQADSDSGSRVIKIIKGDSQ